MNRRVVDHSHDAMQKKTVVLVMPADVAATMSNGMKYIFEHNLLGEVLFCGHALAGLEETVGRIDDKLEKIIDKLDEDEH